MRGTNRGNRLVLGGRRLDRKGVPPHGGAVHRPRRADTVLNKCHPYPPHPNQLASAPNTQHFTTPLHMCSRCAESSFSTSQYCIKFFLACAVCIAALRAIDARLPEGQPLLQPYWAWMLQRWPWLLSHVAFSGLVGISSFFVSCIGFTVLDLRRSYETKIQKHYFPSVYDILHAAVPQVFLYVLGNYLGYKYGYHAVELPALAPRLPVFAEQAIAKQELTSRQELHAVPATNTLRNATNRAHPHPTPKSCSGHPPQSLHHPCR